MCMCMQNGSRDLTSSAGVKMDMRTEPTSTQAVPVVFRSGEGCQSVPCSTFMASRRSCHSAVSLCHSLTAPTLPPPPLLPLIPTPQLFHPSLCFPAWPPPVLPRKCHSPFLKKECVLLALSSPISPLLPCLVICGEQ